MAEKTTKLIVEAQAKGITSTDREIRKLSAGMQTVSSRKKDFDALAKSVEKTAKQAAGLGKAFKDVDKTLKLSNVQVMRALAQETARAAREAEKLAAAQAKAVAAAKKAEAAGPSFGKMAGASFVGNLAASTAGRAVGAARSLGSVPFTGAAGLAGALGAVPYIGGPAAGMMQAGVGAAQQYLAYRTQQAGMRSMAGPGMESAARAAGLRAARGVAIPGVDTWAAEMAGVQAADANTRTRLAQTGTEGAHDTRNIHQRRFDARMGALQQGGLAAANAQQSPVAMESRDQAWARARDSSLSAQQKARDDATSASRRARQNAEYEASQAPFRAMERMGHRFGKTGEESTAFGQEFLGASGGSLESLTTRAGQMEMQKGMGAQYRYGIGAGSAGLIARGAGAGQFEGGMGGAVRTSAAFARGRGLSGSDVTRAVEEIASRVSGWEQTGIPVAQESLLGMQNAFSGALGGIRGSAVGSQFLQTQQQKSISGPQSNEDVYALSALYGYKPGSGAESLLSALKDQEAGKVSGNVEKFSGAGGDAFTQIMGFERARGAGINVTRSELGGMGGLMGGMKGHGDLVGEGKIATAEAPGILQTQARLGTERTRGGGAFVGTAQTLDAATLASLQKMGDFGPHLQKLAEFASGKGEFIFSLMHKVDDTMTGLSSWLHAHGADR